MTPPHGLSADTVAKIHRVFAQFSKIDKAVLYGSRAKGTARPGSDIDLTLFGDELDQTTVARIFSALDDLLLPYQFDISIFNNISQPDLIDHIRRVGAVFYEKSPIATK
jgi:predicted nucleotidyltransferase